MSIQCRLQHILVQMNIFRVDYISHSLLIGLFQCKLGASVLPVWSSTEIIVVSAHMSPSLQKEFKKSCTIFLLLHCYELGVHKNFWSVGKFMFRVNEWLVLVINQEDQRESNEIQPSPQSNQSSAEIVLYLVAVHKVIFYTSLEKFILLYELDVIFRRYL